MRTIELGLGLAAVSATIVAVAACGGTDDGPTAGHIEWTNSKGEALGSSDRLCPGTVIDLPADAVVRALPDQSAIEVTTALASTTLSCKCDKGSGGCSPVSAQGKFGCMLGDNCTQCTIVKTLAAPAAAVTRPMHSSCVEQARALESLAFLGELSTFTKRKYASGAPVPAARADGELPAGYAYELQVIGGADVVIAVPRAAVDPAAMVSGTPACNCTAGSCTLKTVRVPFQPPIYTCVADKCTGTCSMTFASAAAAAE